MGGAALALQAVGGGVGAYGAYQEGVAQNRYYRYMADQSEAAAGRAITAGDVQSGLFQDKGLDQTKIFKEKTAQTFGAQDAAFAASGVSGVSAQDVTRDSFDRAKLDELAIRYNADSGSWAATEQAKNQAYELRTQAAGYRAAGKQAKYAGKINAFSTLLGSAGQIGSDWMRLRDSQPTASRVPDGRTVMPLPRRY